MLLFSNFMRVYRDKLVPDIYRDRLGSVCEARQLFRSLTTERVKDERTLELL